MNILKLKINVLIIFCLALISANCIAQQGNVTINQDENIAVLLKIKKQQNKTENISNSYKIQLYNGNRSGAEAAQKEYLTSYTWSSRIVFDTPNFKLQAGNFRTRLEADRALKKIKRKFTSAFIFKPKKKK
jgi:hypothetical protein